MASRIAAVTTATGTQGFAVTKALSEAGWHVRALTRDPTSQKNIEKFSGLDNVELVAFDIDDIATVRGAFQGVELVYLVTVPGPNSTKTRVNGKVPRGDNELNEEGQGKRVADVAKELGVNLVIQSTISMVDQSKYMDLEDITGKLAIEQYLKDIGQPAVHLSMGMFNENMFMPGALVPNGDDEIIFSYPYGVESDKARLAQVSINHDLGRLVLFVLEHFQDLDLKYKKLNNSHGLYSMNEMLASMSKVFGKKVTLNGVPDRRWLEQDSEFDLLSQAFHDRDFHFWDAAKCPEPLLTDHGFRFQSFEDFLVENRAALGF